MGITTADIRKLGPGELIIGETGSPLDVSALVKACSIKWSTSTEDSEVMLSGDVVDGEDLFTATLAATFKQDDLKATGLIRYSWLHKGEKVPFRFIPRSDSAAEVVGVLKLRPLDVGGDANAKNDSEVEWPCVGEPTIADGVG